MDYVFGNPPYIRVHNLKNNYFPVKNFLFSKGGMTDIFIVFFEIGFNMLNERGKMCLITPSSWLSSNAGLQLRKHIAQKNNLIGLIDLEHFQPFKATTYTLISLFSNDKKNHNIDYYTYDIIKKDKTYIESIKIEELFINDKIFVGKRQMLKEIRLILSSKFSKNFVEVKNGFATLCDKIFIGDFDFESDFFIDIIKASTGKWSKCFFPYDDNGKPLSLDMIMSDKPMYNYLLKNKELLSHGRDIENKELWYLFGRTQAIKDVFKSKISINTTIKNKDSIKISLIEKGKGVYSGLYILTDISFEIIKEILVSDEFILYVSMLKKYKSGGYYTFSSKELELFLNYKLSIKYGRQFFSTESNRIF